MDGVSTVPATRSAPSTEALCSESQRRQGQLSVAAVSESPGHWFSDKSLPFGEKKICGQVEISRGSKGQRALSPSHELLHPPYGSDHQGWASSCGPPGLKARVSSLPAGLCPEGSDHNGWRQGLEWLRHDLWPLFKVRWVQSRKQWALQARSQRASQRR